ncbi:MAG: RNA polymerase sigma factor [Bacteroidales bacterium]|jgi:RNA polymerase sigma-70 factor (ECF subfamily)|nr:RNA polymerase sigma factor [Bacteroidales bacterium]MED9961565.1 RNA polymerase sigma factor [Bacteroidales bacterium]MEE0266555.1 RNA polymerase sigma factor [Bacteroidales bacterium]MEE0881969.1 RNA polymerase sigma factor [Bacteroidales bacterium]MEE1119194.1 RNA polymerase sigma factor [Bacteroidales bacterium]
MKNKKFENQLVESESVLENFAYSLTHNPDEAKDLVQETFLKALLHKKAYKEGTNLRAWLFTIMKNTFINNYRRNKKVQSVITKEDSTPWINNISGNVIYQADHNTKYTQIVMLINTLPEEQKIPFEMMNQGYKYWEIAEKFNIPIGTVKSRIFLARQKLNQLLDEEKF